MKRKRILVCSHWLEIGGAERALVGLLEYLSKSEHDVDLFLCRHTGELFDCIPDHIHLLPEDTNAASIAVPLKSALRQGALSVVFGRLLAKFRASHFMRKHPAENSNVPIEYSHLYTYRNVHVIGKKTYDLVLSFQEPHYIAAYRTKAKIKVAWIHTDYQAVSVDPVEGLNIWSQFDYIAAISGRCADLFSELYPSLKDRIILVENILSANLTDIQAQEPDAMEEMPNDGSIRLLSIGRFCTAKNYDNVPDICAKLIGLGLNVKWYIIGFGSDEALIRRKIAEAHMENRVILLGKKENPYPYIKTCDLYIQPSRYEGKAVTVREAQMLGKPVVITRYATSASQLENGVDGVIVPMDNEGCAAGIAALLRDPEKMRQLSENCKARDYSNAQEVEKLYKLMED